jgi:hypothetical protein
MQLKGRNHVRQITRCMCITFLQFVQISEPYENQKIIFIKTNNSQVVTTLYNFEQFMRKIYVIFIEFCMKWDLFPTLKKITLIKDVSF